MIRLRDVRKVYPTRFGETLVLDSVNLELAKGQHLGVLGRNGAGKSTMIRLISGAELPTSGTVETSMSVSWPLAFGGAFQPMLTGIDNIRFISRIYGQDFAKNLAFVQEFAELGAYLREEVRTYSSGMRARLAFAISMIIEFDCFLIDEIGAVGDARFHERCNRELFQKRGDRAMVIVSHDASYVRDHCDRFAVLHEGQLRLFDDFDVAYGNFRERIGLSTVSGQKMDAPPADRRELIELTHISAVRDDAFHVLVQDADWKRDAGNWLEAEQLYSRALELYPYQRSYWVQRAHCAKEAGEYIRAECAYRTACAFGEPVADVLEHVLFTMERNGVSQADFPVPTYTAGPSRDQPPGVPDVELFARAAWLADQMDDGQLLHLLRHHPNCDALLAAMIDDDRFRQAQHVWIEKRKSRSDTSRPLQNSPPAASGADTPAWAWNLATIACPASSGGNTEAVAQALSSTLDPWPVLMAGQGFAGWERTQAAIQRTLAQ